MSEPGERIGDRLVNAGLVSRVNVEQVARVAAKEGTRLGAAVVKAGYVSERELYLHLAKQRRLELTDLQQVLTTADPQLFRKVPARFLAHHHQLPFLLKGETLQVVTSEPAEDATELAWALGARHVQRVLVTPTDFRQVRVALELGQVGHQGLIAATVVSETPATDESLDATLVALFNAILAEAIIERASDIHLERYGTRVRVRLRIDGDLHDITHYSLTPEQHDGLTNVVKVRSNLDISERRLPQGGRHSAVVGGRAYDLRVQTQPALHGEHVVIRILPQEKRVISVDSLGFSPALASTFRRLLDSPSGLVLVVGPTGSGKSTTLYSGLQVLAADNTRKVITVEDPIEYAIDGIQQTQVKPEIGFNFADAMRVFVREDPDVILVGEIRDGETALEALRASQTGHLVLSTLHCNDSVDAVQRLLDLGMQANSIASELLAVFAQRLARRVCPQCREPSTPDSALLAEVFPHGAPADFRCFKGRGCTHCQGRGTFDRIAVVEHLPASPALRMAISRRLPLDELRSIARTAGVAPMRGQALDFVKQGLIPFDELRSLLSFEQLSEAG